MPDALLVTSSFLPGRGGIESYLAELCESLAPRLSVLAPAQRDDRPLPTDLNYATVSGPNSMLWPGKVVAEAIVAAAAAEGVTKILFGTPWPLVLLAPRLVAEGLTCACIIHGAETIVPGALPIVKTQLARALAACELLLPVSDYTATQTRKLLGKAKQKGPATELLRARVDVERFTPDIDSDPLRARFGIAPEAKVVLSFGRLVPRKGVDRIVEAMPSINQRVPNATLLIAGTGPEERKLRRSAQRTGASVVFAGRVSEHDAPACYALAEVFCLPVVDRWFGLEVEGLGVVLLEAAACGVPCVTGRSGGTPEAVLDGLTGYVVDARDRQALVDRVVELLVDRSLAERMGAAGRAHVAEAFAGPSTLNPLLVWLDSGIR